VQEITIAKSLEPAFVSEIDYDVVAKYRWNLAKNYARTWRIGKKTEVLMHTFVASRIYYARHGVPMPDDWIGRHVNPKLSNLHNTRDNIEPVSKQLNQYLKRAKRVGSVDISSKPNNGADQVQKASITMGKFVKAREHPAKMLDFVDETFDQMPLTIPPAIIVALGFRAWVRRYHRFCTAVDNLIHQCLRGIAPVCNDIRRFQPCQQVSRLGHVVSLPACQAQAQRIAQAIDHHMHFGAKPASTTPQRLRFLPTTFFVRRRRRGVRAQPYYRSSRFPCPPPPQSGSASAPTRPRRTSAQTVCRPYSTAHTRLAAVATVPHCAPSTAPLRQIGDSSPLVPHMHGGLPARSPGFSSTGRLKKSPLSFDQFTSNVNRT